MRFAEVVSASADVATSSGRLAKTRRISALLSRLEPADVEIASAFLSGEARQGRIGIGYATLASTWSVTPAAEPTLEIADVDRALAVLGTTAGKGSAANRGEQLRQIFTRATAPEQDFLRRLLHGELRQGALDGILVDAIAHAAGVAPAKVRRAAMMSGNLPAIARAALIGGADALDAFAIQLMRPVQPMLADSAEGIDDALAALDDAALEYKLDGARLQAHKSGDDVRLFSRTLRDVTAATPEVVDVLRCLPARDLILDGEVLALEPSGRPHPFQVTMRRFGRKLDVAGARETLPLTPFFFDCLYVDGASLLDEPLERRADALHRIAPRSAVPRIVRPTASEAAQFADGAIASGHEGIMAKALAAPYAAGRRGSAWLKVKRARTLDLVVLAAEWGHGRRHGWLSNLHLGARDPATGGFVMLGKTFKGLTDQMLTWQTERLLTLETARDTYTVYVRPELVVEIAFNEIQESPVYPGGLALRFARVKRYRPDKTAADADTIATVRTMHRA
jgi:DNA ligase 1